MLSSAQVLLITQVMDAVDSKQAFEDEQFYFSKALLQAKSGYSNILSNANKYRVGLRAVNRAGLRSFPDGFDCSLTGTVNGSEACGGPGWAREAALTVEVILDLYGPECTNATAWICQGDHQKGVGTRCSDISYNNPQTLQRDGFQASSSSLTAQFQGFFDGVGESGISTCRLDVVNVVNNSYEETVASELVNCSSAPGSSSGRTEVVFLGLDLSDAGSYAVSVVPLDGAGNQGCARRTDDALGSRLLRIDSSPPNHTNFPETVREVVLGTTWISSLPDSDAIPVPSRIGCDWNEIRFDEHVGGVVDLRLQRSILPCAAQSLPLRPPPLPSPGPSSPTLLLLLTLLLTLRYSWALSTDGEVADLTPWVYAGVYTYGTAALADADGCSHLAWHTNAPPPQLPASPQTPPPPLGPPQAPPHVPNYNFTSATVFNALPPNLPPPPAPSTPPCMLPLEKYYCMVRAYNRAGEYATVRCSPSPSDGGPHLPLPPYSSPPLSDPHVPLHHSLHICRFVSSISPGWNASRLSKLFRSVSRQVGFVHD